MTNAVQDLLAAFERLSEPEKHEALVAMLKSGEGDLSFAALDELAEERFADLDREEATLGERNPG